jgi:hypothetical protein
MSKKDIDRFKELTETLDLNIYHVSSSEKYNKYFSGRYRSYKHNNYYTSRFYLDRDILTRLYMICGMLFDIVRNIRHADKNDILVIKHVAREVPHTITDTLEYFKDHIIDSGYDTRIFDYLAKLRQDHPLQSFTIITSECPICLDVKDCKQGYFSCCHHVCGDCYSQMLTKRCMLCRSQ